jgi:hypothetical protein
VNPLTNDNKKKNVFDSTAAASPPKPKTEKNPYKVVAQKQPAFVTALMPVPPRPLMEPRPPKSLINQNILEALADDPDPAATLSGIRKLLVGPTRNLHDAMFEELVTILEESDHDVQRQLGSLETRWTSIAMVSENLQAEAETIRTHTEKLSDYVAAEFARIESATQVKLSELFMAIDAKIEKLAAKFEEEIKQLAERSARPVVETVQPQAAVAEDTKPAGLPHVSLAERLRALRES